jgi:hypothetical protein
LSKRLPLDSPSGGAEEGRGEGEGGAGPDDDDIFAENRKSQFLIENPVSISLQTNSGSLHPAILLADREMSIDFEFEHSTAPLKKAFKVQFGVLSPEEIVRLFLIHCIV